jgi:hypothetical protein
MRLPRLSHQTWLVGVAAGLLLLWPGAQGVSRADPVSTLVDRDADPVVLTGADIPTLNGIAPGDLVAFRNNGGAWQQLPVQVDERHSVNVGVQIYRSTLPSGFNNFNLLEYSDPQTDMGADPDPSIDANDEIAFMAKDAGGTAATFSEPAGVVPGSGVQVTLDDPLNTGAGVVYLFRQSGSLDPAAGQQYVSYTWSLVGGGTYLADYDITSGSGPQNDEDSDVVSPYYTHHFSERWISDEIRITAGAASGVDILDRHASKFPGTCTRSEDTFSNAEGVFFVNKSGPVRAIRSYMGANSGPMSQREHVFYQQRQDIRTFLRVHAIPGISDFFDYAPFVSGANPGASGMQYMNNLNTTPEAAIDGDGTTDSVALGAITWELVAGAQGSLTQVGTFSTNISGFSYSSIWLDDSTPPSGSTCTGDGQAWGNSGVTVPTGIPCTDVTPGCTNFLNSQRHMYYDAPGETAADAAGIAARDAAPLATSVTPWVDATGDSDGDGVPNSVDNCVSMANPLQENNDRNSIELGSSKAFDDLTRPMADALGDACDADDDNDGRTDATEAAGSGCGTFTLPTDPKNADSDGDRAIDGAECSIVPSPTDPNANTSAPTPAQCGSTADADGDGLLQYRERCYYGTSDAAANSDADICTDGREAATVNADNAVNATDLGQVAAAFGTYPFGAAPYLYDFDYTKDGTINAIDLGLVAVQFGTCPP